MRHLKIMSDDVPMVCGDVFGVNDLHDRLQVFCKEQEIEMPRFLVFPTDGVMMCYAVSLRLKVKDQWEEYDAQTVFMLKSLNEIGNLDALQNRLSYMLKELGEPIILTIKSDVASHQQQFFKDIGVMGMRVTWTDNGQKVYEVFVKGQLIMDEFVTLMEHVEYIGKEIIYV